jgi:type IV pilus assembly protein PilV
MKRAGECGFSMMEVLVTIAILMFGLLGMVGLQLRATALELESYQRAQALILLQDMADRLSVNKPNAASYVAANVGAAGTEQTCSSLSGAARDLCEWNNILVGAAEKSGTRKIGAMIGARGCISYNAATEYLNASTGAALSGTGEFTVAVSWQGMADTFTPTATCGKGLYGSETKRRTVWTTMRIGILAAQ